MRLPATIICCICLAPIVAWAQQPAVPLNYQGITGQPLQEDKIIIKGNKSSMYRLSVYDVAGKAVLTKTLDTVETALSSCQFRKGNYSYVITDERHKVVKKGTFAVLF